MCDAMNILPMVIFQVSDSAGRASLVGWHGASVVNSCMSKFKNYIMPVGRRIFCGLKCLYKIYILACSTALSHRRRYASDRQRHAKYARTHTHVFVRIIYSRRSINMIPEKQSCFNTSAVSNISNGICERPAPPFV